VGALVRRRGTSAVSRIVTQPIGAMMLLDLYSHRTHNFAQIPAEPTRAMPQASTKERRLNIRCDEQTRALLDRAAGHARVTLSEFVLSRAVQAAEQVVRERESISLPEADFTAFLTALDAPAEPSPALLRAARRHAADVESA
jgi:uncharacterized protein (DUF1778 family)